MNYRILGFLSKKEKIGLYSSSEHCCVQEGVQDARE